MLGILDRSILALGSAVVAVPPSALRAQERALALILSVGHGAKSRFAKAFRPLLGRCRRGKAPLTSAATYPCQSPFSVASNSRNSATAFASKKGSTCDRKIPVVPRPWSIQ